MHYIGCPYQIKPKDYPANEIDPCEFCPCDDDYPYPASCPRYQLLDYNDDDNDNNEIIII